MTGLVGVETNSNDHSRIRLPIKCKETFEPPAMQLKQPVQPALGLQEAGSRQRCTDGTT